MAPCVPLLSSPLSALPCPLRSTAILEELRQWLRAEEARSAGLAGEQEAMRADLAAAQGAAQGLAEERDGEPGVWPGSRASVCLRMWPCMARSPAGQLSTPELCSHTLHASRLTAASLAPTTVAGEG